MYLRDHYSHLYTEATARERQPGEPASSQLSTSSMLGVQGKDPTQFTLQQSINRDKQYPLSLPQAQEFNQAVSYFIAKGMHPLSTVES